MPIPARRRPSRAAQPPAAAGAILFPAGRWWLQGCLFVSGGSSLGLEVAWSRALSLSLGNSHQAGGAVVASMMAGAWLGGLGPRPGVPRLPQLAPCPAWLEDRDGGDAR